MSYNFDDRKLGRGNEDATDPLAENYDMLIDRIVGEAEMAYDYTSEMDSFIPWDTLTGTNGFSIDSISDTGISEVGPTNVTNVQREQEMHASSRRGTLDTIVNSRFKVRELDNVQSRMKLINKHAKAAGTQMALQTDYSAIITLIKAAQTVVGTGAGEVPMPRGHVGGHTVSKTAAELADPVQLEAAIRKEVIVPMNMRKQGLNNPVILMDELTYQTLLESNKLIDWNYNSSTMGNGNFSKGIVHSLYGVPIRIMKSMAGITATATTPNFEGENVGHEIMSNPMNDFAYDATANDASAKVLVVGSDALIGFNALSMSADYWWDKDKQHYMSHVKKAYAVHADQFNQVGAIFES